MNVVDLLAVMDNLAMLATDKGAGGHEAREARAAVAELIAQRDMMANALRKLDLIVLPAAIKYRSIGPGDIEEAQEIVRAALARAAVAGHRGV